MMTRMIRIIEVEVFTQDRKEETLIDVGTVFFANQLKFEVKTTLGRTVEIRKFHSDSTKNTSLEITFVL